MVRIKKQISIILILAFFLSLAPDFLYNERGVLAGCPYPDCNTVAVGEPCCEIKEENGKTYCTNCPLPIRCNWGGDFEMKHTSCLPIEEAGEWGCGVEIPIGEAMHRTALLANRMYHDFTKGIIGNATSMIDEIKGTLAEEGLLDKLDRLSCEDNCEVKCHKYFVATEWTLVEDDPIWGNCAAEKDVAKAIGAKEECQNCTTECETECNNCANCCEEDCSWTDTSQEYPSASGNYLTCEYCPAPAGEGGDCLTQCTVPDCQWIDNPFDSVIRAYNEIESSQERLKNDIEKNYPEEFKFRSDNIQKQLNFARCELSKCYISAEEYPKVMTGELTGKHLFTCKSVTDMGLLEDDQLTCLTIQAMEELNYIIEEWARPKHWWEWPATIVKIGIRAVKIGWQFVWHAAGEIFGLTAEEGCFPTNYYCCEF